MEDVKTLSAYKSLLFRKQEYQSNVQKTEVALSFQQRGLFVFYFETTINFRDLVTFEDSRPFIIF